MNGKSKTFVVCAIFCLLQFRVVAEKKCKFGVSYEDYRTGGKTLEEVKNKIEYKTCSSETEVCLSIRADELEIKIGTRKNR